MKKLWATLKTMSFKEAVDYIWEYYKLHIFGIIFGGFFVISILTTVFGEEEPTYDIMTISNISYEDVSNLSEQLNQQGFEEYRVTVDTLGPGGDSLADHSPEQVQKFFARVAAGSLDIIVTNEGIAQQLYEQEGLTDLGEVLDLDKLANAGVELYQFGSENVYAIDTSQFAVFRDYERLQGKYMLIPLSAENKEKSKVFLETLLN